MKWFQRNGRAVAIEAPSDGPALILAIAKAVADELRPRTIVTVIPEHLDSKQVARLRETIGAIVESVSLEAAKRNS